MSTPRIIIEPTTAAAASEPIRIGQAAVHAAPAVPLTFMAWGFTDWPADAVRLEWSVDGETWHPATVGGELITLDADTNIRTIYGPGLYRLAKNATNATVGAAVSLTKGV